MAHDPTLTLKAGIHSFVHSLPSGSLTQPKTALQCPSNCGRYW